jgi:hypothetical protein
MEKTMGYLGTIRDANINKMSIDEAAQRINQTAHDKGWYNHPDTNEPITRNFGEVVALMHSELSEALEAWRENLPAVFADGYGKPEGWAVELVDCVIRIFDTLHENKIDIADTMAMKMAYNDKRAYRHGGKKA